MRLPGHLLPEAFVESDVGLPAEVTLQLAGVGERVALVAGARRLAASLGGAARAAPARAAVLGLLRGARRRCPCHNLMAI